MNRPLTIVEATNRLGIGGVESHVTRLTRGLIERGHRVIILTQDTGVHAEQVRAGGADIVATSFDAGGRRTAIERLDRESVDVVHAHNYRAARFAAPLAADLHARYLMTVHGPRPWHQRALFRAWSDPVITVSEADKRNITGLFGVAEDRVVVSFLGVDTGRFHPDIDGGALRAEWGIPAGAPLIINVSRFSHRKARPPLALIEALPRVREHSPEARVVLVGDGPKLPRIESAAARLESAAGDAIVQAVGPRTDIPQVLNVADLVIATATTALESLACATPTIAYGRTGYFGPVTPENFEAARAVCFGDHGRRLPARIAPQQLADDILSQLRDPKSARKRASEVRATITDRYNVERMVAHVEAQYRRVIAER